MLEAHVKSALCTSPPFGQEKTHRRTAGLQEAIFQGCELEDARTDKNGGSETFILAFHHRGQEMQSMQLPLE